jgi:hypothetical protein
MKILENGVTRDATPNEIARRKADIAAEEKRIAEIVPTPEPTKQQLLAEVQGLLAKIEALK